MLNNLVVVIISQSICMSNHHFVYFKYVQFICQLYLIKAEKSVLNKRKNNKRGKRKKKCS